MTGHLCVELQIIVKQKYETEEMYTHRIRKIRQVIFKKSVNLFMTRTVSVPCLQV